jgi:hypothetical protein
MLVGLSCRASQDALRTRFIEDQCKTFNGGEHAKPPITVCFWTFRWWVSLKSV